MTTNNPEWDVIARRLRRAMGLSPPTPAEADAAIASAGQIPLSDDEVSEIVRQVTTGASAGTTPRPIYPWADETDTSQVAEDSRFVMNRNAGDDDEEVNRKLDELRRKALENDGDGKADET